jgi:hypothetical protein
MRWEKHKNMIFFDWLPMDALGHGAGAENLTGVLPASG